MKIILTISICMLSTAAIGQSCEVGLLDPRVKINLSKIADLKPMLQNTSIEQVKQDQLEPAGLYPDGDVTRVAITTDSLPIYIFNATHDKNLPVILYFHPGGFVTPFLPFMKYDCWKMSKDLHAIVFAVDYRIAPAYKFPAAVDDAYTAFEWLLRYGQNYGGNIDKLVVSGLSAGANLAAVVSHKAKANGLSSRIKLQVLNCPSVDNIYHQATYPSYDKYASGYFQTKEFIVFAQKMYCDEQNFSNPDFAPLLAADFSGLPPVVMVTTEFDVLRDEEMAYVSKLRKANVKVWHHCFTGQIHCLIGLPPEADEHKLLNRMVRDAMAESFLSN